MTAKEQHVSWNSRIGFILASAGSAVGLGAIWKFPYMAGSNGGATFLLCYIFFSFTLGLSLLISEYVIGKAGHEDAIGSLRNVCGKFWSFFGITGTLTSFLILCFYSTVAGWCLRYLVQALTGATLVHDAALLHQQFDHFVSNGLEATLYQLAFLVINATIICKNVNAGIERLSKILMPLLFILMLILIVRGMLLPGAWAGVEYLFFPHWEDFTISSVLNAMGFCFFSLSLGSAVMITYASYLPEKTNLLTSTSWIAFLATIASLLGGLMVMPTVFAFGLDPTAGPGLTFVTMPAIFADMPFGQFFEVLFYLCLLFAALTSSVSMAEPTLLVFQRTFGLDRSQSAILVTVIAASIGILCTLSFGSLSSIKLFGKTIFNFLDFLTSNIGMSVTAFGVAVAVAWVNWNAATFELQTTQRLPAWLLKALRIWIGVISPLMILVVIMTFI